MKYTQCINKYIKYIIKHTIYTLKYIFTIYLHFLCIRKLFVLIIMYPISIIKYILWFMIQKL